MHDAGPLVLAFVAGAALGAVYFGGLWWTIRRGLTSARPALWFLGSLVLRTGIVVGGLIVVAGGRADRLLGGLLGVVLVRTVMTRLARKPLPREARRAP